ncbi:MAG TPA: ribosome biogenesis GTPase Der [Clostridia bacterium]|jgi:GTP-binding protein|nr:ribosome biogenesis GTPase Der [Clostridia bacterium]HQO55739.1 ribosome biogenesis GTPase Der [Clostridia bacterium]HUM61527.1 ribosome biogenesis GTPase Der [Clostridia bacterium]
MNPLVAIVGRPNVGKSTFFNAIAGKRIAIVDDIPGVTRDRIYADTLWNGRKFTLIDTGGIDTQSDDVLLSQMRHQAQIAIETADLICFFTDARHGLTHQDEEIADILRRSQKPVLLVINKLDHEGLNDVLYEGYSLGLGDPVGISSTNLLGLGDLLDEIVKRLPPEPETDPYDNNLINLAIVGRPNVGKSSLANRLLGEERVMVSDIPGTTRDAIDTRYEHEDGSIYNIIDTAGIRRKRSIEDQSLERYSVLRSIAAIRRCDVAILIIDAQDGVTEQDMRIAGLIHDEGKAVILAVNKWDAIEKETGTLESYRSKVLDRLKFISYAPVLFISALTGQRVSQVWEMVSIVYAQAGRHIPTGVLNELIGEAQMALQPPMEGGQRLKIYYATQQGTFPPSFLLFVNNPQLMHFAYERYLENQMRKAFEFTGTPIRFYLRERSKEDLA